MRLATVEYAGQRLLALYTGHDWFDLAAVARERPGDFAWPAEKSNPEMVELIASSEELVEALHYLAAAVYDSEPFQRYILPAADLSFCAPITRPSKILSLVSNFRPHAEQLELPLGEDPAFYAKAPSTIISPNDAVTIPALVNTIGVGVSLAVVIARRAKSLSAGDALDYVLGYTILDDITAVNVLQQDRERGLPWFRAKSFDTFSPLGPWIALVNDVGDPHDLQMTLRVNGEVRQEVNTADLVYRIPSAIAYISRHLTLEPGDIIATGPAGAVTRLRKGDVVECEIERIGVLGHRIE